MRVLTVAQFIKKYPKEQKIHSFLKDNATFLVEGKTVETILYEPVKLCDAFADSKPIKPWLSIEADICSTIKIILVRVS